MGPETMDRNSDKSKLQSKYPMSQMKQVVKHKNNHNNNNKVNLIFIQQLNLTILTKPALMPLTIMTPVAIQVKGLISKKTKQMMRLVSRL